MNWEDILVFFFLWSLFWVSNIKLLRYERVRLFRDYEENFLNGVEDGLVGKRMERSKGLYYGDICFLC